ncbi:uncharacterized protein [Asterias amurensis]|uniref:uncharacterized protein n=1 Tax=Asterias amurensis TaxID=7602 RepID=UPI003AB24FB7
MDICTLIEAGKSFGLSGKELMDFVQKRENEAKERENESKKEKDKLAREERAHQLEIRRQDQQILDTKIQFEKVRAQVKEQGQSKSSVENGVSRQKARTPKLPTFNDSKDDLDAYLKRYERYATSQDWCQEDWAINLSALLTGKALEVYSRLPTDEASNYQKLKSSLLKRFQLTADGFRLKLRTAKPEGGESGLQFATRLANYLLRWIDLAEAEKTFEGVCDLLLREQFTAGGSRELALFLKERQPKTIATMATIAEQYLEARGGMFGNPVTSRNPNQRSDTMTKRIEPRTVQSHVVPQGSSSNVSSYKPLVTCYICHKHGHMAKDCRYTSVNNSAPRTCFNCHRPGHIAKNCYSNKNQLASIVTYPGNETDASPQSSNSGCFETQPHLSTCQGCSCKTKDHQEKTETVACMVVNKVSLPGACCNGQNIDQVTLKCGHFLPIMSAACSDKIFKKMPVTSGRVGKHTVSVLRDSGCSGVVIRHDLVSDDQLTGEIKTCVLIDGTARQVPVALVTVSTPFFTGETEALCMTKPVYDLIIGNVTGARSPDDPDESWTRTTAPVCAVQTRAQTKSLDKAFHPLKVPKPMNDIVTADSLQKAQEEDVSLHRPRELAENQLEKVSRNQATSFFFYRNGLLFRRFQAPNVEHGDVFEQVVVPQKYRSQVMRMAHETLLGGHQGPKKTTDRVLTNFFWPGITADITRYCRSCDVCQRTVPKGRVTKVPLGSMPLIESPFERIAVDIVGPIHPITETRNRYILTIIDYATRYPEAIPLPSIEAERVAEALVSVFTRVGVPKQMLTDQGSQFTSEIMKQVCKLLSVHRMTTTPYHPMCNGLVERFNGTLKQMLKRMCVERPRDWDRYINPLLFAIREAPQESLGFSPFEMLYGRQVRGPMTILRELWTGEVSTTETKTTYQYIIDLRERLENTCQAAHKELQKSSARYKHHYDKRSKVREFSVGDKLHPLTAKETIADVNINATLHHEQRREVNRLLGNYPDILTDLPGKTTLGHHTITLHKNEPIRSKPYPLPHALRDTIKEEVSTMLKMGVVEPSNAPFASPIVLVKKPDGSNRFCVDFRKLNQVTVFDAEPIPDQEELFTKLATDNYFTKIDLSKGYWQVPIDEFTKPLTSFITPDGLFQFTVMPFGLVNAPATFSRIMRKLLQGMNCVVNYIDDILVHTASWEQHVQILTELFRRLRSANLTVRPSKCFIGHEQVEFLGHVVGKGQLQPRPEKIITIQQAKQPETKKQLRSFLGMTNYYRRFIPNYSAIAVPLTDKTKNNEPTRISWEASQQQAFSTLKDKLTSAPILHLPDLNKEFILRTDASDLGLGAVLLQAQDGEKFPVAYASKKLLPREKSYSVMEKECLAIIWAVRKFEPYLYGRNFTLETDHQPLTFLQKSKVANGRIMRWALALQPYRFHIEAIKGSDNIGADFLSRSEAEAKSS